LHHVDLLDDAQRAAIVAAIAPSHLLHLAWFYKPRVVWQSPANVRWLEASLALVREFGEGGGERAVTAGTCFEYDPAASVCRELTTRLTPNTLYGTCKAALGRVGAAFAPVAGISVAHARVFLAYGRGEDPGRLVPSVARSLLAGEPARVSHGRQLRDYLSSEDVAGALAALLLSGVTGPVNVGSGSAVTLRELITTVAQIAGRPELVEFGAVEPPFDEPAEIVADVTRLRDEVGFTPRWSLRAGLEDAVAALKAAPRA
jgi:nucleoside-diphosphate-sugar epimerase